MAELPTHNVRQDHLVLITHEGFRFEWLSGTPDVLVVFNPGGVLKVFKIEHDRQCTDLECNGEPTILDAIESISSIQSHITEFAEATQTAQTAGSDENVH